MYEKVCNNINSKYERLLKNVLINNADILKTIKPNYYLYNSKIINYKTISNTLYIFQENHLRIMS